MRRRSSSHSPISLFTFLDTLVCTMGSLILMLLAMTPKIRERAEARELARLATLAPAAQQEPEPPAVEPVAPPPSADDEQERAAARQKRRDAWLASLADARDRLEKEQSRHHRQRELLKEAGSQLKDAHDQIRRSRVKAEAAADASQSLTERETQLQEHQAKIAQKIAVTRKNIDVLSRRQSEKPNEYALVPYDGSSGTVRRPIYLECSKKGFRFLPEDETVSPVDLQAFSESFNPLLTGAEVLLRYWSQQGRESGTRGPTPYVLMLIRPSGVERYYEARGMLAALGANFGYELIEEDWNLSIPRADPGAKAVLKETLDRTVQMQSQVRDAFSDAAQRGGFGKGGGAGRSGWGDDSNSEGDDDGFGGPPGGSGTRGKRRPSIQFGPATRRARDIGEPATAGEPGGDSAGDAGTAARSNRGAGTGDAAGSDGPSGSKSGPARGTGIGGKSVASRPAGIGGGARPGATGARASDGTGSAGDATGIDSGTGADAAGAPRGAGPGSADRSAGSPGDGDPDAIGEPGDGPIDSAVAGKVGKQGTSRGGGRASVGSRPGRASHPATLGGTPSEIEGGGESSDDEAPLQIPPDYVPRRLPGAGGNGSGGGIGDGDEPSPLKSLPQEAGGGKGSGGGDPDSFPSRGLQTPGSKSRAGSSAPASSATDGDPSGDDSGGAGPSLPFMSGSGNSGSPSGGQLPMGGPGVNVSLGSKGQRTSSDKADPDDGPRLSDEDSQKNGPRGRSMGPRLWGRARPKATIGLERKLEIRIMDDRILVGSKDIVIPVGNGETVEEMVHFVVAGIDRAADKWGDPPTSFYWLPTVKFVVYPGGNQYYERLHEPLEKKWGVTSTVEYAPDKSKIKTKNKSVQNAGGTAKGGRP
jgi:hypothetical protein